MQRRPMNAANHTLKLTSILLVVMLAPLGFYGTSQAVAQVRISDTTRERAVLSPDCAAVPKVNQQACTSAATGLQFWLFLPTGPTESAPLLNYLHGFSRSGSVLDSLLNEGLPSELSRGRQLPMVVISPQCPSGDNWQNPKMVERLSQLVDEVIAIYHLNARRVYLTGFSMGVTASGPSPSRIRTNSAPWRPWRVGMPTWTPSVPYARSRFGTSKATRMKSWRRTTPPR